MKVFYRATEGALFVGIFYRICCTEMVDMDAALDGFPCDDWLVVLSSLCIFASCLVTAP